MTLEKLFQQFRSDIDDRTTPYLWTDSDLEEYFNWAAEELAKETMYFLDQSTWEGLAVTADSAKITATSANYLDRILFVRRATLVSNGARLSVKTMSQADSVGTDDDYGYERVSGSTAWETNTGTPALLITDYYEDGSLRLGPVPTAADALNVWAYRLPLHTTSYETSKTQTIKELLGVREHNHELVLIRGMMVRAYMKDDPETRDEVMAEKSAAVFYDQLSKIKHELQRRRHPAGKTRYGGIR